MNKSDENVFMYTTLIRSKNETSNIYIKEDDIRKFTASE